MSIIDNIEVGLIEKERETSMYQNDLQILIIEINLIVIKNTLSRPVHWVAC